MICGWPWTFYVCQSDFVADPNPISDMGWSASMTNPVFFFFVLGAGVDQCYNRPALVLKAIWSDHWWPRSVISETSHTMYDGISAIAALSTAVQFPTGSRSARCHHLNAVILVFGLRASRALQVNLESWFSTSLAFFPSWKNLPYVNMSSLGLFSLYMNLRIPKINLTEFP